MYRRYSVNNRLSEKEYRKKYYKKHKKKLDKKHKRYIKKNKWLLHYQNAKTRCNNKKQNSYKYYGAKGIKMLLTIKNAKYLWFRDKAYLMKKPSIDRKNNKGDYELSNCRFIELKNNVGRNNTKLTKTQIKLIRILYKTRKYSYRQLGKKFNTIWTNISLIINHKTWKYIK